MMTTKMMTGGTTNGNDDGDGKKDIDASTMFARLMVAFFRTKLAIPFEYEVNFIVMV